MPRRKLFYLMITSASELVPGMRGHYPALVWNCVSDVANGEVASMMQRLLATGCRYIVAAGVDCERWHDIADEEFLTQFPTRQEQDANFVMTSWHSDESPDDATFFLVNTTNFDDHDFTEFLILQFGEDPVIESQLKSALNKWSTQ